MTAKEFVDRFGDKIIGKTIYTYPLGQYPGGYEKITEVLPDENAPEIVFQVEHPTFGSIGVFENEKIDLI